MTFLSIRSAASSGAVERGRLFKGEAFTVTSVVPGSGCRSGWGELAADAFACLDQAKVVEIPASNLPRPLHYEPPFPEDYEGYSETGLWEHRGTGEDDLLPFVYARRWKDWRGRVYRSVDSYLAGDAPSSQLPQGRRARFVDAVETDNGVLLVREDGTVVPEEDVYVFPITRFQGRNLETDPIPDGRLLAWVFDYENAALYTVPNASAPPPVRIDYHRSFFVDATPAAPHWWRVPNAFGPGLDGYVEDELGVRVFHQTERPEEVADDEVWIDIARDDTVLAMYRGDDPIYVTLTSPGQGNRTPLGTWRIEDKRVWHDMQSRAGSDDPYYVEAVPWTMFFKPMYAIHAAYWHWGFGNKASHGCINVSPRDARYLFEHTTPNLPTGWHTINADDERPGTLIRIH